MATVFVEIRMLKDTPAVIGTDMNTYGPFFKGRVYALPKENARLFIKQGLALATRKEAEKPTLKEMFKGEVLIPYIEAALTKPLFEEPLSREQLEEYVVERLALLGLSDEEIDSEMNRIVDEALRQPNPREYMEQQVKIIEEREITKVTAEEKKQALRKRSEELIKQIQEDRKRV